MVALGARLDSFQSVGGDHPHPSVGEQAIHEGMSNTLPRNSHSEHSPEEDAPEENVSPHNTISIVKVESADQVTCRTYVEKHAVVPGQSWGTLSPEQQRFVHATT